MKFSEFFKNNAKDTLVKVQEALGDDVVIEPELNMGTMNSTGTTTKGVEYYFNIMNPDTGFRFDIPLLKLIDNDYKTRYAYYMKLREEKPEEFKEVMAWN